jgi:hypothetical protein
MLSQMQKQQECHIFFPTTKKALEVFFKKMSFLVFLKILFSILLFGSSNPLMVRSLDPKYQTYTRHVQHHATGLTSGGSG